MFTRCGIWPDESFTLAWAERRQAESCRRLEVKKNHTGVKTRCEELNPGTGSIRRPQTERRLYIQTSWRALRTLRGLIAVRHSGHKTCPFTIVLWACVVTHRTQNFASEKTSSFTPVCVWRV